MERQGLLLILMDALQTLKEKANAYTSKAALGMCCMCLFCKHKSSVLSFQDSLFFKSQALISTHSSLYPGEGSQRVTRQVKEAESEAELVSQGVTAVRGMMERVVSAWETYNTCIISLQTWLAQKIHSHTQSASAGSQVISPLFGIFVNE